MGPFTVFDVADGYEGRKTGAGAKGGSLTNPMEASVAVTLYKGEQGWQGVGRAGCHLTFS